MDLGDAMGDGEVDPLGAIAKTLAWAAVVAVAFIEIGIFDRSWEMGDILHAVGPAWALALALPALILAIVAKIKNPRRAAPGLRVAILAIGLSAVALFVNTAIGFMRGG